MRLDQTFAPGKIPPNKVDVVVVGGGIVGTSAALYLAQMGISVALCEKGRIAGEQSSRNWGWIRKAKRDPRELPLMFESARLWGMMGETVGTDIGYRATGHLFAAETDESIAKYEDWIEQARDHQVGARIITGRSLDQQMAGAGQRWKGALYSPNEAQAEPQNAAPAIAGAAEALGAKILTGCAVRGVELSGGRVSAALTESGRIECDTLVVCSGVWTSRFLRDLGLRLPQLKVRSSVLRTAALNGPENIALWCKEASFRKRADGGYTIGIGFTAVAPIVPDSFRFFREFLPALLMERSSIKLRVERSFLNEWATSKAVPADEVSPYERTRTLDPEPDRKVSERSLFELGKLFPVFSRAQIVDHWAGMIDVTPDMLPVISAVDSIPGLAVATGFSGHGFGIGPGAGKLIADIVSGAQPTVDAKPFRFSRFVDGSDIRPTTGL
jgi:glycine/D-amino acid oxidase-like deaminating enzyme